MTRLGKRLGSRWRLIKEVKSNAVLVISGCLLVLLSLVWRCVIAPAVRVFPSDFDQIHTYTGTLTIHQEPPNQSPSPREPVQVPIKITRWFFSPVSRSTPEVSVVEVETETVDSGTGAVLSRSKDVYALDRRTGKLVDSEEASQKRNGYYIVFPFDTPRKSFPLWSNLTESTTDASYVKKQQIQGLDVYDFKAEFSNEPIPTPPSGYPQEVTGSQLKQIVSMPDLAVGDDEILKPRYLGSAKIKLAVEPKAGTIVEVKSIEESVNLTVEQPDRGLAINQLMYTAQYKETADSLDESVEYAKDEVAKLRLQFVYLPLGFLLLGLACLLVGAFVGVKSREKRDQKRFKSS